VRELCGRDGVVLIFNDTITGFRGSTSGVQSVCGVTPDLSTWGKAMGNGFTIAAIAGRRTQVELGGLNTDRPRVFLLSSTHGAGTVSLAAFRAVVRACAETDPVAPMERRGAALAVGVNAVAAEAGVDAALTVVGRPSCQIFRTANASGAPSQAMRMLFLQEIMRRGVLGQSFVIAAAPSDADVEQTVEAAREATVAYRKALETGRPENLLKGRPVAPRAPVARRPAAGLTSGGGRPTRPGGTEWVLVLACAATKLGSMKSPGHDAIKTTSAAGDGALIGNLRSS
jgi:glutamate-1-semialdehyde 2,1-aminomutase